jgi:hypothetical protein
MPGRSSSHWLAAVVIAVITAVYLVLAWAVLNPRTFFTHDPGVKYLQAYTLAQTRWRELAVRNPAPHVDPDGRFSALLTTQFRRRSPTAPIYGVYSELFTVPVSVLLAMSGTRAMYLLPILAATGVMVVSYRLASRTSPNSAWLAPLLVGACSPIFFYSVDFWEHSLALLLFTVAVLQLVAGTTEFALWRFAFAGLALGLAIAVREELYAMIPAGLVGLTWLQRRRLPAALAAAAAGTAIGLVPLWVLRVTQFGQPVRGPIMRLFGTVQPAELGEAGYALAARLPALTVILPASIAWALVLIAALLVRWAIPRLSPRRRLAVLLTLAAAIIAWVYADAVRLSRLWANPVGVLQAFPVIWFLLFLPRSTDRGSPARREIRQLLTIAAVFAGMVCILEPIVYQPDPRPAPQVVEPFGVVGPEWGPRFVLPVYPLLAAAIVFALDRRRDWTATVPIPRGVLAAVFAALTLASLAVQVQGIRVLRVAKAQYESVLAAVEALDGREVIVSDIWWFGPVTAAVLYGHEVVVVDVGANGSIAELLARVDELGITSLTTVTADDRIADTMARAGWKEHARRLVRIWLDLKFVSYRRAGNLLDSAASSGQSAVAPTGRRGGPDATSNEGSARRGVLSADGRHRIGAVAAQRGGIDA